MTHTKGPWVAEIAVDMNGFDQAYCWVSSKGGSIDICSTSGDYFIDEEKANADLIASAPELLEACERIAADGYGTANGDLEFLMNAIAKAKGET